MKINKRQSFRCCFLLEQGFSHLSMTLMLETLHQANRILKANQYQYELVFDDLVLSPQKIGYPRGITKPFSTLAKDKKIDLLVLLGGIQNEKNKPSQHIDTFIRQQYINGAWLAAMGEGVYKLASLELLKNMSVSCHVNDLKHLSDQFPKLRFNAKTFSFSDGIYTCAGGLATADLMLDLIDKVTPFISQRLHSQLVMEKPGNGEMVRVGLFNNQLSGLGESLINAIELMESNLSEPLAMQEIAYHSGVSTRQLERLFQKHLANSPKRFYLQLRLKYAREKIINTSHSVLDVALSCGFTAPTHFSKCYKDYFGISPRQDRLAMFDEHNNVWVDKFCTN